jgi:hypothetical protein
MVENGLWPVILETRRAIGVHYGLAVEQAAAETGQRGQNRGYEDSGEGG